MGSIMDTRNDSGFTLIEVMIALTVLLIGMLGIAGMFVVAIDSNAGSKRTTEATYLAEQTLDKFRDTPYGEILNPTPTDITNNTNINAKGDKDATRYPCVYTRTWTVSEDTVNFLKTITVSVNWNYQNHPHSVSLVSERSL